MRTSPAQAALAFWITLATGCATVPPTTQITPASARQAATSIDIAGRLSVRYQSNGKDEALHGSFNWSQHGTKTLVTLLSPLGQTLATIDIGPDGASLQQAGQPVQRASDPDALAATALGWPLPVAGLRDWLQGIAIDAAGNRISATPDLAMAITTADGWQVLYPSWDNSVPGAVHPRRIDLSRITAQAGEVAIRIVIDDWQTL